jgi:hypothetical protein
MSERTSAALEKLDRLVPRLTAMPSGSLRTQLVDEAEALGRAVEAFHMEAIRFRMFSVDRLLKMAGDDAELRRLFDELRQTLEAAGFHTRSHTAP